MNYQLVTLFSFSILIPGVLALVFFKRIEPRYYPFIFCLWIGCLNEILSFLLITRRENTTLNINLYVLAESLLLTWYFKKTGTVRNQRNFFIILLSLLLLWITEVFVWSSPFQNTTYFRIFYSMILVFLSIQLINQILFSYHPQLLKNPDFVLCVCFIIYFTIQALIQAFVIYGVTAHLYFLRKIYDILIYVNLGVNLLFTLAVLWMPGRLRSIRPSLLQSLF